MLLNAKLVRIMVILWGGGGSFLLPTSQACSLKPTAACQKLSIPYTFWTVDTEISEKQ